MIGAYLFGLTNVIIALMVFRRQHNDRIQDRQPVLIPSFARDGSDIVFQVTNTGATLAKDIKITSDPPVWNSNGRPAFRGHWMPEPLAPAQSAKVFFDRVDAYFGCKYLMGDVWHEFEVTIIYRGLDGHKHGPTIWTVKPDHLSLLEYGCTRDIKNPADETLDNLIEQRLPDDVSERAHRIIEEKMMEKSGWYIAPRDDVPMFLKRCGWQDYFDMDLKNTTAVGLLVSTRGVEAIVTAKFHVNEVAHSILWARELMALPEPGARVTYETGDSDGRQRLTITRGKQRMLP